MKKDWTELLREKMEGYAPDVPQASFEQIKKKMLAAGAAAGAGAAKGSSVPMKNKGLRYLAYAASLAAVVAGGALLLRNNSNDTKPLAQDEPVKVITAEERAAMAEKPVAAVADAATQDAVQAQPAVAQSTPAQPSMLAQASKKAPRNNNVISSVTQEETAPQTISETAVAEATPAEPQTTVPADSKTSTEASKTTTTVVEGRDIYSVSDDPFADVEPIRKQIKKFSLGASGFLANASLGGGDQVKSSPNGMTVVTDRAGNKYYSMGAPELQYHYTAPVSGGISLRYNFTNQFYAETGVRFTYLRTWVTPTGARQNLLYAGIPVALGCKFLEAGGFDLYGSLYGMGSKCILGRETTNFPSNYTQLDEIPLMWSAGIAPGAEYHFGPLISVYAEPTFSYYFKNEAAPQTIYKDNPIYFTVNIGVRFNL